MRIQRAVRKITNKFSPRENLNIYSTGSSPRTFYCTKKNILTSTGTISSLAICLIISNIGTAWYELAKYLGKWIPPLSKSGYMIATNMKFMNNIKSEKVPTGHSFIHPLMWNHCLRTFLWTIEPRECSEQFTMRTK